MTAPVDSNFIHLRKDFLGAGAIGPMRGTLQSVSSKGRQVG